MRKRIKKGRAWILFIFYFFSLFYLPSSFLSTKAATVSKTKLFSIQHWLKADSITWGRTDYPMTAFIGGTETIPLYYCSFYLTITPKKGDVITIKASKEDYFEDKIFLNIGK